MKEVFEWDFIFSKWQMGVLIGILEKHVDKCNFPGTTPENKGKGKKQNENLVIFIRKMVMIELTSSAAQFMS